MIVVFLMPSLGSPSIGAFLDNRGAIDLSKIPLSLPNRKHIVVRYHFLSGLVRTGGLPFKNLQIMDQHADILTKAIRKDNVEKHAICCSSLVFVLPGLVS